MNIKSSLKDDKYQCELCKKVYKKGLSDKEAEMESLNYFGEIPEEERTIVCDTCFNQIANSTTLNQHIIFNEKYGKN